MRQTLKRFAPSFVHRAYEHELHKETHINRALRHRRGPTTYVEIGVRDGACIRQIEADRKMAVDPAPVDPDRIASDGTEVYQVTSDAFFESDAPGQLAGSRVDVALADGLHEFRQTLRDVLNLERHMAADGVVFVHDCNPPTRRHAEEINGPWNGDVWKVAYYLHAHRPDLRMVTLDCDWGLGVITGFDSAAPTPDPAAIEEVAALDYSVLEADREKILDLRSPLAGLPFYLRRLLTGSPA